MRQPVLKEVIRHNREQYRPQTGTLMSYLAKIMEGFTLCRAFPDILRQLDTRQFAVAGRSNQHPIVYLLHLAFEALDRGSVWVRWFFADFKKGFDLIDHHTLLAKLGDKDIHPCVLRWVASFLEDRTQVVRIGSTKSPSLNLNAGIPQGGGFCLGKGHTTADFNRVGRYPSLNDVLYNSAMMGESILSMLIRRSLFVLNANVLLSQFEPLFGLQGGAGGGTLFVECF